MYSKFTNWAITEPAKIRFVSTLEFDPPPVRKGLFLSIECFPVSKIVKAEQNFIPLGIP